MFAAINLTGEQTRELADFADGTTVSISDMEVVEGEESKGLILVTRTEDSVTVILHPDGKIEGT